ncbi:hypothetical protein DFJ73DRAFT_792787 [Zopfochytrium polystomum]|nr:hypothetical protein DFJ73DRAFT_792787 [Zopfochytrium polystomum]
MVYEPPKTPYKTRPSDRFPLGARLATYAGAGLVLNAWSRAIARLPIRGGPLTYVAWVSGSMLAGYGMHRLAESRFDEMERQRDALVRRRMLRLAAAGEE